MSGILLGALAYSGLNKSKYKTNERKDNIKYSSNMKDSMNRLEQSQSRQNFRKPEFLNQFDDLRFDNIGEPAGENDTYNTLIGANSSLKRDIMAKNNFTFFDSNRDGTYNVVTNDNFTHNNMFPSTTQRDVDKSVNYSQRKMETFTGSSNNIILKQENKHLFEPVQDLTYIKGAPVYDDLLKQRYLASNKNNMGNLPFASKAKVLPGIEGAVQDGVYSVYRINPPNVDQLRSDNNKKITYNNKPLEAIKKGEVRGADFNLTQYKLPDFRERKFSDLIPNKANVEREKQDGIYTNMDSQRGNDEFYQPGPSTNTNIGDGPDLDKTFFEASKKENYENDNTHAVVDTNFKPVFTNAQSYGVCNNQRTTVNTNYQGGVQLSSIAYTNRTDIAKQTIKETTSHNIITNMVPNTYESYSNITDDAKQTIKQTTSHNIITNLKPSIYEGYSNITDDAKQTIKQTTSHNIITNLKPTVYEMYSNITDNAKQTIKQTTSHNIISNVAPDSYESYASVTDTAKKTIKQGTSHNIVSNIVPDSYESYANKTDKAKKTIKQGTSHNIVSNIVPNMYDTYANKSDVAKDTIKQTTENTSYIGSANDQLNEPIYKQLEDDIRPTIKQTTVVPQPISNVYMSNNMAYPRTKNDKAKETIKQTTIDNNYIGNVRTDVNGPTSHEAANNMEQNICRESTAIFNRPANGKADRHGPYIDRDNVEYANTILYSYAGNPHKTLDHSITPTLSNNAIQNINIIRTNSKPQNQNVSYYINSNYINTLNNNPFVNDIYHQKNYK